MVLNVKKKKLGKLYILINFIGLYNKMNFKMNFKKNDSFCFKVRGSFVDILDRWLLILGWDRWLLILV